MGVGKCTYKTWHLWATIYFWLEYFWVCEIHRKKIIETKIKYYKQ